jgi:enoyl-CoA hydratase/carnithine racemase
MAGGKPNKFTIEPGAQPINIDALSAGADLQAFPPYDPAEDREKARRLLAYALLALLATVVFALLGADFAGWIELNDTKDLAASILSPIVVLVGTALGFYFGGQGK